MKICSPFLLNKADNAVKDYELIPRPWFETAGTIQGAEWSSILKLACSHRTSTGLHGAAAAGAIDPLYAFPVIGAGPY